MPNHQRQQIHYRQDRGCCLCGTWVASARGPLCPGLPQGTKPSSPNLAPSTATNPASPHLGTDEEVLGLAEGAVLLWLGADIAMCVCVIESEREVTCVMGL